MRGFGFAIAVIAMLLTLGSITLDSFWYFDALASLRVQAVFGSGVLALIALTFRKWYAGGLLVACMAVNAALMAPFVLAETPTAGPADKPFSLLFHNSAHNTLELLPLVAFVREKQPDVLFFTEVRAWDIRNLRGLFPDYRYSVGDPGNYGVVTLSKLPISDFKLHKHDAGPAGRIHEVRMCSVMHSGKCLAILALHAARPIGAASFANRTTHMHEVARRAAIVAQEASIRGRVLVLGDFNLTPWSRLYGKVLEAGGLFDIFAGGLPHSTWFSTFAAAGLAIDHVWAGPAIGVAAAGIGPLSGSDHLPVHAELGLDIDLRQ